MMRLEISRTDRIGRRDANRVTDRMSRLPYRITMGGMRQIKVRHLR